MMKKRCLFLVLLCFAFTQLLGQAKLRKMPANINHTGINNFAPYISLDGNSMVYVADVAEDNVLSLSFTVRDGSDWRDPIILPKHVNNHLNFTKGYALSPDGNTLYFTNAKSNGIGGYDIYTSERHGNSWGEPVNISVPVNSKTNDACPSLSVDGNTLFFMRCEIMNGALAERCRIMMAKKTPLGQWAEPVELPSIINSGNSQTPRIMGDDETLIFSSNKILPAKGGMDLYLTRNVNGQWTKPQPVDFANTAGDDQFVSASAIGRYLLKDAPGLHTNELLEVLFPAELRPKTTIRVEGSVSGLDSPSSAYISIFNIKDQRRVFATKTGKDGTFVAYIKEGAVYDLSVDPEKDNYTFYSKSFDLTREKFPLLEKVSVALKPAGSGDEIILDGITFKPGTSELEPTAAQELRRVLRMMGGNPNHSFKVSITLQGYQIDTVRSNPDLTELQIDTLRMPITYQVDSVTTAQRDSIVILRHYHNDRTALQAQALGDYFIQQGIPAGKITVAAQAIPEAIVEKRKTLVKITIQ